MALTSYKVARFQNNLMRKVASDPGLRKVAFGGDELMLFNVMNHMRRRRINNAIKQGVATGMGWGVGVGAPVGLVSGLGINAALGNTSLGSYLLSGGLGLAGGGLAGTAIGGSIGAKSAYDKASKPRFLFW